MRCWWCGVKPDEVIDVRTMESEHPIQQIAHWSDGDHPHAERQPTPGQLQQAGHEALMRIQRAAA